MPGAYGKPWGPPRKPGGGPGGLPFRSSPGVASYKICGVSRDAQGNALPLCNVILFFTGTDQIAGKVVSEAVTGAFAFPVPDTTATYYIAFFSASGALAGITVNTLTGG